MRTGRTSALLQSGKGQVRALSGDELTAGQCETVTVIIQVLVFTAQRH